MQRVILNLLRLVHEPKVALVNRATGFTGRHLDAASSCPTQGSKMNRSARNPLLLQVPPWRTEHRAASSSLRCVVCGSQGPFETTLEILLRCLQCNLIFADPHRTDNEVVGLYNLEYFNGAEYADYAAEKAALQKSFRAKIVQMAKIAPYIKRVFEIGAAYGFFLELARERWEAAGIDIAEDATAYARTTLRVNVEHGDFLHASMPAGYYDTFCMWDTIEHLARPDAYVARVAELIAPGGYLFISTGNIASAVAQRQGRNWRLIHPPTHLFYFSPTTLSRLLARCGFQVCSIQAIGMYRSVRQTAYSLFVLRHSPLRALYNIFATTPLGAFIYYLNLGDIMLVAAQAKGEPFNSSTARSKMEHPNSATT